MINELDSSITTYRYDAGTAALTPLQIVPTLPGDFTGNNTAAEIAVAKSGRYLFGSNRGHDSVAHFAINGAELSLVGHTSVGGKYPRHITLDPSGAFLFAANQNSNNVTSFAVDRATGKLTPSGTPLQTAIPVCVLPTRLG